MSTHTLAGHPSHRAAPRRRIRSAIRRAWHLPAWLKRTGAAGLNGSPAFPVAAPPEPYDRDYVVKAPEEAHEDPGAAAAAPGLTGPLAHTVTDLTGSRRARPYVTPPDALLARFLPEACTRPEAAPLGRPSFAGTSRDADGRRFAGLFLGPAQEGGQYVIDARSAEWLRDLAAAAIAGAEALEAAPAPLESRADRQERRNKAQRDCWAIWWRASQLPKAGLVPEATLALDDALGHFGRLANGLTAWRDEFPELAGLPDPLDAALTASITQASDLASRVIEAVAREHGEDVAMQVAGRAEKESPAPAAAAPEDGSEPEPDPVTDDAEVRDGEPEPASRAGGAQ